MINYSEYFFFLTLNCPNRCKYCYIDYNDTGMTKDDIDKYIAKYSPSRIIFFGGEPLLKLDLIEYTVKKYYGKMKFQVVTSTMVNFKEFINFHKEYPLNEVQLSWDGFTNSRVDIAGRSIEDRVYQNILYAISRGVHFDIKTVINNENISQLTQIHKMFKSFKKRHANGEFVIAHGENYSEEFYKELDKQLINTFDLDKMYVEHLNKICAYLNNDRNFCSCDIGKYNTITPNGHVNNCTIMSQYNLRLDDTKSQHRCLHPDCIKCPYGSICDGGCRYERWVKYKDDWDKNYLDCTCKIVKIYANTIQRFLDSLSEEDTNRLIEIMTAYKKWQYKNHNMFTNVGRMC